jgi:hypothetical protein
MESKNPNTFHKTLVFEANVVVALVVFTPDDGSKPQ